MNKSKILERIKALYAKAQSLLENRNNYAEGSEFLASLKQEAQALIQFARTLQNKHAIADAELVDSSSEATASMLGGLQYASAIRQNVRGQWFEILCAAVGKVYTVRFAFPDKLKGNACIIVGDEEQTHLAASLLDILIQTGKLFFDTLAETLEDLKKFEYLLGFAMGCFEVLKKDEEKPQADEKRLMLTGNQDECQALVVRSQALALRTQALAKIDQFMRDNLGGQSMPPKLQPASESMMQGLHDGKHHKQTRL